VGTPPYKYAREKKSDLYKQEPAEIGNRLTADYGKIFRLQK
jgi:hypothetical protein